MALNIPGYQRGLSTSMWEKEVEWKIISCGNRDHPSSFSIEH